MKSVIFGGLVLGSLVYLVSTQTELLPAWQAPENSLGKRPVSERQLLAPEIEQQAAKSVMQPGEKPLTQHLENLKAADMARELKASVSALKGELGQLTQALQEMKKPAYEESQRVPDIFPEEEALQPTVQSQPSIPNQQLTDRQQLTGSQQLSNSQPETLSQPLARSEPAVHSPQAAEPLPRREIVPDAVPVRPYMPVKERSDALLDLAQRMEMKAAGY